MLNRVVRCTEQGWELELDQRHADLIIKELDLEGAREVITPGEKDPKGKEVDNEEDIEPDQATKCRGIVARANYLATGRPHIVYATKELCRGTANPTSVMWHRLERLGRYLVGTSRTVLEYDWQDHEPEVTG